MNEMQNKLKRYYEEASIASVKKVIDENGCYDYEEMLSSFRCPKKDSCRDTCKKAYECSVGDTGFLFSPRTECIPVSQYYEKREYEGHRIPRIVVVSLSAPKPELKAPCPTEESRSCRLGQHWRGTTTTVRSLLAPFSCLAPAGNDKDESTRIIEQLFVHNTNGEVLLQLQWIKARARPIIRELWMLSQKGSEYSQARRGRYPRQSRALYVETVCF